MGGENKHDDVLLHILKEEGQIIPFLDSIFGFLYRRTDFYIVKENEDAKLGFIPGVAEMAVRDTFRKWQKIASDSSTKNDVSSMESNLADVVIHEEEVVTTEAEPLPVLTVQPTGDQEQQENSVTSREDLTSDTFNGADCGTYRWSQTAQEVDIKVPVHPSVKRSGDVQVEVGATRVRVGVRGKAGHWDTLVDGELSCKHFREESIWTLLPGKHVTIHLQKVGEKWWESLFSTEQKLDITMIDMSRHVTDLPEADHMQVEKLLVQEERKRLGILPPDHQEKLETLKKAWNAEGSPFQGQPFDPSVLQLPQQ